MVSIETCEPYFKFIQRYTELDAEAKQLIATQTNEATFRQKEVILSEGAICTKAYFIISGTARSYYTDFSGVTVTWSFHFNNHLSLIRNAFATDYRAFLTKQPSSITI